MGSNPAEDNQGYELFGELALKINDFFTSCELERCLLLQEGDEYFLEASITVELEKLYNILK